MKNSKKTNTLLWQVSPREGGPVSYLFGTMHTRDLRAFTWLDLAYARIEQCEVFAAEYNFSQTDSAALATALLLPEGTTLDQLLSRRAWKNLAFYAKRKLDLPPETLRQAHPMYVQMVLTTALLREEAPYPLDEALWMYALNKGKSITGLETFEEQLEVLRRIPLEDQLKSLTYFLKHYRRQRERLKAMLRWYQEGNIRSLYQASRRDARWLRRPLLLERNVRMAKRFAEIAHRQSLFGAVGAAHLAGGKGMLRLLKQAGFRIKPILLHVS
ncbi:MAG: TraB/GumN family protein [Saprospiraceae bacterium]|nr:TraB/GumN family protein [Saprospiraceae bacterium]MDW8482943.1 TraB/GumN family protein [Saprospiraceae bacterium]